MVSFTLDIRVLSIFVVNDGALKKSYNPYIMCHVLFHPTTLEHDIGILNQGKNMGLVNYIQQRTWYKCFETTCHS
jgi:hypothetical protein